MVAEISFCLAPRGRRNDFDRVSLDAKALRRLSVCGASTVVGLERVEKYDGLGADSERLKGSSVGAPYEDGRRTRLAFRRLASLKHFWHRILFGLAGLTPHRLHTCGGIGSTITNPSSIPVSMRTRCGFAPGVSA
jgi:hypothetical protein